MVFPMDSIILQGCAVTLMGGSLYRIHSYFLNSYLSNQNTFLTSLMIPPITLVITTVIATNLFLSLGMIGALSIVRYRTPVKSQYELALLFGLITIGIAGGVNFEYSLGLFVFLACLGPLYWGCRRFFPRIFPSEAGDATGNVDLLVLVSGDIAQNMDLLGVGGTLISIDTSNRENRKETNIHLKFPNMDAALKAQSKISGQSNILSLSLT